MLVEQTLEKLTSMRLLGMAAVPAHVAGRPEAGGVDARSTWSACLPTPSGLTRENARLTRACATRALQAAGVRRGHRLRARSADSQSRRSRNCKPHAGFGRTRTSSSPARPVSARATSPARSGRKPAATGYSVGYRRASRLFDELAQARADGTLPLCSAGSPRRTSSSSTTSVSRSSAPPSAGTCSRCSRIATAPPPPSSPANSHRTPGTPPSATDARRRGLRPARPQRPPREALRRVHQEDQGRLDQSPEAGEVDLPSDVTSRGDRHGRNR